MTYIDFINRAMLKDMKDYHEEDTVENRLAYLKKYKDRMSDAPKSIDKAIFIYDIDLLINALTTVNRIKE